MLQKLKKNNIPFNRRKVFIFIISIFVSFIVSVDKVYAEQILNDNQNPSYSSEITPQGGELYYYKVCQKTGDMDGAGTNSDVYVSFDFGRVRVYLDDQGDNLERGSYECFNSQWWTNQSSVPKVPGTIDVSVSKFDDDRPEWYLEYIEIKLAVQIPGDGEKIITSRRFPANRWVLFDDFSLRS